MRRLVFAEPAERDLDAIVDYVADEDPAAAEKIYRAIVATSRHLAGFPDSGRPGRLPDTREFPVPSQPYLIVYRAEAEVVTILAVFHGARDLARALVARRKELKE
ncbi:hypothetical protein GCM10011611_09140 [Aliidongia dinghuensis]|uniref:Type II toxin-antitoxin system RelE/ParE family toxin n=1 Tax=Aliidongia dinghuensis TaxID=1867774 RepID=A0A8J3E263_9PROT|nr:type II toxin-antitoxin system RelE/ParE family toxin [Aliidongia dinghuensis]GGF05813.1 hypothetical protein GCM10011611_09140 [Aliidongia dinghuensis]